MLFRDRLSYLHLFVILKFFSRFSGLSVNDDKTKLFGIGPQKLEQEEFYHKTCTSIKILGIYFDYHKTTRRNLNFNSILKSIKKTLNMWRWRGLTLLGRIQIVKTFAIPKFMYKASLISVSEDLIKDVIKLLYGFIWNGNDMIKRTALINDIENGGLKMLDVQSMILSQRVVALKLFIEDYNSPWKSILETFLGDIGGKFNLCCNFDTRKLPIYLPDFYKECLDAWSDINTSSVVSYDDVVNQNVWDNKFILIENKSCYIKHLVAHGIVKIGDLISDNGRFLESQILLQQHVCPPSNDAIQINIEIYSLPFTVAHDTKTREFQYKLLNNIVFTNEKLFRFKMIDSPLCAFCQTEVEPPEHLFFHCNVTKSFWQLLFSWISEQKVILPSLTLENVFFGVFYVVEDFHVVNHIILLAKYYIYNCKLNVIHPSLKVFIAKVKATCQIEQKIATTNNKLDKHLKKWNKFLLCLV